MKVNRLLAGILSLVLISGFGAPVFAGVSIFVPTTGDMYGSSAHPNLGSTGSIFLISQLDGSQTFIGDPTTQGSISGLAFDSTGKLWGTNNKDLPGCQGSGCLGSSELIEINPNTGAFISSVLITDGTDPVLIQDLATQPGTDIIFGTTAGPSAGTIALVTIDRNSGIVSQKGLIIQSSPVLSIAFDPNTGTLYGVDASSNLHTLNPNDASILNTVPTDGVVSTVALGLGVNGDGIIFASVATTIFTISQAGDQLLVIGSVCGGTCRV